MRPSTEPAEGSTKGEEIESISAYCYGIAQHVLQEQWKKPKPEELDEAQRIETNTPEKTALARENESLHDRRLACLRQCIDRLPEDRKELLLIYTASNQNQHKQIAQQLLIEQRMLSVRVDRIRQKLKKCVTGCLKKKPKKRLIRAPIPATTR